MQFKKQRCSALVLQVARAHNHQIKYNGVRVSFLFFEFDFATLLGSTRRTNLVHDNSPNIRCYECRFVSFVLAIVRWSAAFFTRLLCSQGIARKMHLHVYALFEQQPEHTSAMLRAAEMALRWLVRLLKCIATYHSYYRYSLDSTKRAHTHTLATAAHLRRARDART